MTQKSGAWVLVVDDEVEFANLLTRKIENAGYRTQSCGKVPDAVMKLNNQKFDCIILDIRLEQGSGERVVELLRTDTKAVNFATPILLMSGFVDAGIVRRLGNKVSGVFVKPFSSEQLLEKVKQLVGRTFEGQ